MKHWKSANTIALVVLIVCQVAGFGLKHLDFFTRFKNPGPYFQYDFGAFYVAAAVLNSDQPVLYNNEVSSRVAATLDMRSLYSRYIYPPFFAVVFRPLAQIPYTSAISLWLLLNFLFWVFAVREIFRLLNIQTKWMLLGAVILVGIPFPPVYFNLLVYGQTNLLLLWLLLLIYRFSRPSSSPTEQAIAGIALGLGIGIKLFMVFLVPYFLLYRRSQVAIWGIVTFGMTLLIGMLGAGWSNTQVYLTQVLPILLNRDNDLSWMNLSLCPSIERLSSEVTYQYHFFFMEQPLTAHVPVLFTNPILGLKLSQFARMLVGSITLFTLGINWLLRKGRQTTGPDFDFALLVMVIVLLIPLGWFATLVLILLPAVFLLAERPLPSIHQQARASLLLAVWALLLVHSLWMLWSYIFKHDPPPWLLFSGTLGGLTLWSALVVREWMDITRQYVEQKAYYSIGQLFKAFCVLIRVYKGE